MDPSRRDALKRIGTATAVLAGAAALGKLSWDPGGGGAAEKEKPQTRDYRLGDDETRPQLVIARNQEDPAALVQSALAAMGGMARFVSRGDVVVVKPNIGWDRTPIHAANTNPVVVAEVVRQCASTRGRAAWS
jgi:hypothetical protein